MNRLLALALLLTVSAAAPLRPAASSSPEEVSMKKLTPVLVVDKVEPCVAFWTERLGFQRKFDVPGEDGLAFAAVEKGGVEIMYQTRASVAEDLPPLARDAYRTVLFIEVEDLDAVERAMQGAEIVQPRRTTFYGMTEIGVREPGGNVVIFAQPTAQS